MANQVVDRTSRLPIGEKLGYGVGDMGFNFYWATISAFLLAFYTDTFGLSAGAAGTMMLITKFVDACTDPVMGAIADRTRTKFGKFRPYLLWAGLPMAGAAVMTFSTPDLGDGGKLVYAYLTYTFMMLMYTVLSTPYSALSGVMTAVSQDRTSLISIRFVFAFSGTIIVNLFTLDLVRYFGQGDATAGWQATMILYGFLAALAFLVTFLTTKERIAPPSDQQSNPIQDIRDLLDNRPWVILFALAMIIMMTFVMRGGSAFYYFKYFLERPDLIGLYLGVQGIFYMLGAATTPLLTRYIDKARLLMVLMSIVGTLSIVFWMVPKPDESGIVEIEGTDVVTLNATKLLGSQAAFDAGDNDVVYQWQRQEKTWLFLTRNVPVTGETGATASFSAAQLGANPFVSVVASYTDESGELQVIDSAQMPNEIWIVFLLNALISFFLGPKSPLTWSMYADAADYTEWQKGRRATAMTFSAATFSQKVGGALGSAVIGWVLSYLGYAANEAQSGASLGGILMLQTVMPGIFALIAAVTVIFYDLSGEKLKQIQEDLVSRELERENGVASAV